MIFDSGWVSDTESVEERGIVVYSTNHPDVM